MSFTDDDYEDEYGDLTTRDVFTVMAGTLFAFAAMVALLFLVFRFGECILAGHK